MDSLTGHDSPAVHVKKNNNAESSEHDIETFSFKGVEDGYIGASNKKEKENRNYSSVYGYLG